MPVAGEPALKLGGDLPAQLGCGLLGEGDRGDIVGHRAEHLHDVAVAADEDAGFSGARVGGDRHVPVRVVRLLLIESELSHGAKIGRMKRETFPLSSEARIERLRHGDDGSMVFICILKYP